MVSILPSENTRGGHGCMVALHDKQQPSTATASIVCYAWRRGVCLVGAKTESKVIMQVGCHAGDSAGHQQRLHSRAGCGV